MQPFFASLFYSYRIIRQTLPCPVKIGLDAYACARRVVTLRRSNYRSKFDHMISTKCALLQFLARIP